METRPHDATGKHVKQFAGSDCIAQLAKGSVDAAFAWSGDIVQIQADNPHVTFVFPQEGCVISASNLVIPALGRHKANAEKLVSYYYYDPEVAASELIFPDEQRLASAHGFMSLTQEQDQKDNAAFSSAIGL